MLFYLDINSTPTNIVPRDSKQYLLSEVQWTRGVPYFIWCNLRHEIKAIISLNSVLVSGQFGGVNGIMIITPPATMQTTNIPAPIKAPTASFAVCGSVEEYLLISKTYFHPSTRTKERRERDNSNLNTVIGKYDFWNLSEAIAAKISAAPFPRATRVTPATSSLGNA